MRTDLSTDELKVLAREAQRAYDKAVHDKKVNDANKIPLDEGVVIATSNKVGFEWRCNADGELVVRHVVATINSAVETLNKDNNNELHKVALAMGIMTAVSKMAKAEAKRD